MLNLVQSWALIHDSKSELSVMLYSRVNIPKLFFFFFLVLHESQNGYFWCKLKTCTIAMLPLATVREKNKIINIIISLISLSIESTHSAFIFGNMGFINYI